MRDALSRIVPHSSLNHMSNLMAYSGIGINVDKFFSMVIGTSLFISAVFGLVLLETNRLPFLITFTVVQLLQLIAIYSYMIVSADKRGRFVETVLPDVLKIMASNLKSGLTVDKALVSSARPEFGFFSDEIKLVASKMMAGKTFEEALQDMNKRIKSKDFTSTTELIIQGISSGGKLAEAMDSMADILMNREMVKKEIKTGVQMYTTLVIFAIVGGAPMLFGISSFLIEVLKGMSDKIMGGSGGSELAERAAGIGVMAPTSIPIGVEFIRQYAIISLLTTSIIGSLVVALISTGNWKRGVKNIPVFSFISVLLFLGVNRLLMIVMGSQFM
jgi:archaeal flagellar protein FlaJ